MRWIRDLWQWLNGGKIRYVDTNQVGMYLRGLEKRRKEEENG